MAFNQWLRAGSVLLFVFLAVALLSPLSDIDLWWHLATCRYLVETGAFLSTDPFGLAASDISPSREILLNGYWLSQIVFYGIYKLFGLYGIVFLRVLLLMVPPAVVLFYGSRVSSRAIAVLLLALLCGWAMVYIDGIRPNHVTVALVPVAVMLLASLGFVADGASVYNLKRAMWLPVLILVWANAHAGYFLGMVLIVLYAVGETATRILRRYPVRPVFGLWGAAGITFVVSLFTPNGIIVYGEFLNFQGGVLQQKTSEFLSPVVLAKAGTLIYWPFFLVLLLVVALIVLRRGKLALTRVLMLVFLSAMGLSAFRYAPLFVGGATVLMVLECREYRINTCAWRWEAGLCSVLMLLLVWVTVSTYQLKGRFLLDDAIAASRFPVSAANFIERENLFGVTFNHFNWGGYLAWEFPGRVRTFVDGRTLNLPLFHAYTRVLWLPEEAQSILDQYGVKIIVVPRLNPFTGELYALTDFLWASSQWRLVYRDADAMILLRRDFSEDNSGMVELDKGQIYRDVLRDLEQLKAAYGPSPQLEQIDRLARFRLNQAQFRY